MECLSISALIQLSLIIKQLEAFGIFQITQTKQQFFLLYNWRFSRYSAPIHWLVHGHMTSNNETVSRQMPWAGNIAKTMMSNGKQFTAVPRDRWNLSAVFKVCFCFVLLYNKSFNDWPLGEQWILFPSNLNVFLDEHWDSWETKFTVLFGTSH